MKTVIEMALEAGFPFNKYGLLQGNDDNEIDADAMFERFAELVRADERARLQPKKIKKVQEDDYSQGDERYYANE